MKQRISFKRRVNGMLRYLRSGGVWRQNFVPVGYIKNRKHMWPKTDEIGSIESVRFVVSK